MVETTRDAVREGRRVGWGLLAIAAGALILMIAGVLVIALAGGREPPLAPASTPEGVVQRFFAATYRGDYAGAYALLGESTRRERTLAEFQASMRYQRDGEMRVDAVAIHDGTATVTVTVTHFSPGGLFGGGEWSTQYDMLLERDGATWRIVGEPFW
ncbi:MAG TPA: hypothetical protein PKE55_02770 [Kiritimatiellia bacterium]|nr:hypothetical protein [Kiritimatiellia bacterium]